MYKIIQNNNVIDVVRIPHFVRFLKSSHVALTDKTSAHGIVGSDDKTLYSFKPVEREGVSVVSIEEITLEEFNKLYSLLNSGQDVCADEAALATAKSNAIKRLSKQCRDTIISGFSLKLSDGKRYSFKLTIEDQLNLMSIENQLNSGVKTFIYHATEQPCKVFSHADMAKIISAFKRYTLYHTTYFNVAKQYINTLPTVEKVNSFKYGDDVSKATADSAIKRILKNGGNVL